MLQLTLAREKTSDLGTFGFIRVGDARFLTGELPWRGNKPGLSCTKAGVYILDRRNSAHFHMPLYHLQDRDGRTNEEIHPGNWCGDVQKGYASDVKGCILLGFSIGDVLRPDKVFQLGVAQSKHAVERFMELTKEQPIELTIVWHTNPNPEEPV